MSPDTGAPVFDREAWLEARKGVLGSSEISSIFYQWETAEGKTLFLHMFEAPPDGATCLGCVSRHKTGYRLFLEKTSKLDPDAVEGERIDAGVHLEPALATWAQQKWAPWSLRKAAHSLHPKIKGFGASRDYEEAVAPNCPVEFKNVDFLIFRDLWQADGDEIIAPPMDITLQCQHQLAGNAAPYAWIVACVGGNSLKRGKILRHEPTIAKIENAVRAFWAAVGDKIEPLVPDFDAVADLYACGVKDKSIDLTGDNEAPELCAKYLAAKAELDVAEARVSQIKAQLGAKLGDHTRATVNGFRITWVAVHREEKLIPAKMQKALDYRGAFTVRTA